MKKFSLLLGTLGGAFGAYLLSNTKLRKQLANASDAESAAKILGRHLQDDGKKVAKEVKHFVQSDEVQTNLKKLQKYAVHSFDSAKKEVQALVKKNVLQKKGKKK